MNEALFDILFSAVNLHALHFNPCTPILALCAGYVFHFRGLRKKMRM